MIQLPANTPFFPPVGNHEYENDTNLTKFYFFQILFTKWGKKLPFCMKESVI